MILLIKIYPLEAVICNDSKSQDTFIRPIYDVITAIKIQANVQFEVYSLYLIKLFNYYPKDAFKSLFNL